MSEEIRLILRCYHCVGQFTYPVAPPPPDPCSCPCCGRPLRIKLAINGPAHWSFIDRVQVVVDAAAMESSIEDCLTRSYKKYEPSDYDDAKQEVWDLYTASKHIQDRFAEWRLQPTYEGDSEALVMQWISGQAPFKLMAERLPLRASQRKEGQRLCAYGLAPWEIINWQLSLLKNTTWGPWLTPYKMHEFREWLEVRKAHMV